jgi:hypothetical protein
VTPPPRLRPRLAYIALALTILAPLLLPGYILTLDMVWTPHTPGGMWGQKLLLLAIFVLAGVGAHKLVRERFSGDRPKAAPGPTATWPAYLAGLIYMINPFVYTRLMAGQYLVLAGYALLPWLARAMWRLLERPDLWRTAAVVAWAVAIGLVSLHTLAPAAVLAAALVVAAGWGRWDKVRRAAPYLAAAAGAWLLINAFWLVPLLLGRSRQAQTIAGITADQFAAYATTGGVVGVPANVLSLQGFWADPYGRYVLPAATGPLFWAVTALVLALVAAGVWRSVRRHDRLGLALAAAGLIGWVLAMGESWGGVAWLNHALVQHVPFYRGYREPHKWAMLLALAYAYLAAVGVGVVRERLSGWTRDAVSVGALLLPVLWTPMLLWGAAGQLRSAQYPVGWAELNQRLDALPAGGVVMLPWHQYIALDFAGRTVANPAPRYFDRPVISSDDPELIGVAHTSPVAANRQVQQILNQRFFMTNAGSQFSAAGIRYLVLLKQADWHAYAWLDSQSGLTVLADAPDYRLYEIE